MRGSSRSKIFVIKIKNICINTNNVVKSKTTAINGHNIHS
uniref:Uncharacterized protein n=1 Tax=Arundo donax TaxID=35708 RepID=A0A0A9FW71_ARUDO